MARRTRGSPQRGMQEEQWLRRDHPHRERRWAYDELLFGRSGDRERLSQLRSVMEELEQERAELARLYLVLDEHLARISSLERRLQELTPGGQRDERRRVASAPLPHTRAAPPDPDRAASEDRSYSLARCEGFEVESPTGVIGVVEGLRFASRIDRPDLLEVRGGRFGRQLLLIPSEQVEEVRVGEERVVVRGVPLQTGDLLADVVDRVRRALHVDEAT